MSLVLVLVALLSRMAMIPSAMYTIVNRPPAGDTNSFYHPNIGGLRPTPLVKLPINSFQPGGWLKRCLELQRDGLTGHLGQISVWLTKQDNGWLSKSGQGKYGWEEVPYWLRGYSRIAYVLKDPAMLAETKFWIEGTLSSQRPDGDFGPIHNHSGGFRDLWAQMLMLQVLQSWYEYSHDDRVLPFMGRYFAWEKTIPDARFLKDYWENSRGGDNLASVYWLYDRTHDGSLLSLAQKIDRNTADWRQVGKLPNLHNVNVAECFREPATFYQQSGNQDDLTATYRDFDFIREKFGQVPGGMFGADENARAGHDDPHQAVELCGMVEQLGSNELLTAITADPKWVANTEDVAYNTLPAALMPDYRSLRYLTAPNMVVSDAKNHSPGLDNGGPFLLMNPFSSRCCQHNHSSAWVNFLESTWMATQDNGLAALILTEGSVKATVSGNKRVTIHTTGHYPFAQSSSLRIESTGSVSFPLYVLIPSWATGATVRVGDHHFPGTPGKYVCIRRTWKSGDQVLIDLPMHPSIKTWSRMKNAQSVEYGPLTFSLKIAESYVKVGGKTNAEGDSGWQAGADETKWPTYEILPKSDWNYGLTASDYFKVIRRPWPSDQYPFSQSESPLQIETIARKIPLWKLDQDGLVGVLPRSPIKTQTAKETVTLIPMGAARLRISSFPATN